MVSMVTANASSSSPSLPSTRNLIIDGYGASVRMLHQALADAAEAHLNARHRGPCTPKTRLLFARMDFHGVGNDLNQAMRALACALSQDRQVIYLPPSRDDQAKHPWLKQLGITWQTPWHWLHRAGLPFDSLLVASSCQLELARPERKHLLQELANTNESDAATTLTRLGEIELAKVSRSWHPIWRVGLTPAVIPAPFRSQGLLWWFQVLGSYLIRARGPLQKALQAHPAMLPFRTPASTIAEAGARSSLAAANFGRVFCHRGKPCDDVGAGWHPPVWFDVGLHIRMGDVCGKHAPKRGQKKRKCSQRPLEDALTLMRAYGLRGNLFFASDAAETVAEATSIGPSYGFNVSSLAFERSDADHDATACSTSSSAASVSSPSPASSASSSPARTLQQVTGLELCKRGRDRELALLLEALLDTLMLSRSSVLVGAMMSNFPRLALQIRVQVAGDERRYLALDGREWCSRSSCRTNYTERFGTA